jgi:hypothetical protein
MRWLLVMAALAACGKSGKKNEPPPPATDDAAPVATADAVPAPAIDAAAAATGPALPAGAVCSGHWTATLNHDSSKTCKDDQLAPYRDLEVTVAAGPAGWTATIAKPPGLTAESVRVTWETADEAHCSASVVAKKAGVEMNIELSRWPKDKANARIDLGAGDAACMGNGIQADAVLHPDSGALPPPAPALVALGGAYQLALELPATYKCADEAARLGTQAAFDVAIDRANGDALLVTGLGGWTPDEVRDNGNGQLSLRATSKTDERTELLLLLDVKGDAVTGTAATQGIDDGEDAAPVCPFVKAKVTGTRTAKR